MLKETNQLDSAQLKQLDQLLILCKEKDGSTPKIYPLILKKARIFPASLLYYMQQQLFGFLGVYFFYEDTVEISLLVHPLYRRQGIARELIISILPLIHSLHYKQIIFSSPAQQNNKWLLAEGFSYLHSEYYMERKALTPLLDCKQPLSFRKAEIKDIPFLCTLDELCFSKEPTSSERFQQILNDAEYQIILAYQNEHCIGKAHFHWLDQGATLSDIAITPTEQGKGLGTLLITYCINMALSLGKPRLDLDVEAHNERALKLYIRLGFITQNATDYWTISLNELSKKLKIK